MPESAITVERRGAHRADVAPARHRIRIGAAWIDAVTFEGALGAIADLVDAARGGMVVTPNVDHIVRLDGDEAFREAYAMADLALADGMPVLWGARALGTPLPAKVSGSDLVTPLARLAAARGWRVYLLGGAPGAAASVARQWRTTLGLLVVGVDAPVVSVDGDAAAEDVIVERVRAARPHLVLLAFGAPKQERLAARIRDRVRPAVLVSVGMSLSFVAGHVDRAPALLSRLGLEWLFRLVQEPRRLWKRYLLDDPRFAAILWRTSRLPRAARTRPGLTFTPSRP